MKPLNSIQNLEDRLTAIYYSESRGAFHICQRRTTVTNPDYQVLTATHPNIASSFVTWASKHNNLSNQPDKSIDYIGDKPEYLKILSDWNLFISVYKSITIK